LTYNLWDTALSFDFTQDWVQDPACGSIFSDTFTWTGTNAYIVQDSSISGRINVDTTLPAAIGTHTVSVQNTVSMTSNGSSGATSFAPTDGSDKVEFIITIADPCRTTTVNTITITGADSSSPYSLGVADESSGTITFVRPTTTAEDSNGVV
jgi:hypothetical protein